MQESLTKNLTEQEIAWYQLVSAAGSLLDRFQAGEVTEKNREDVWLLREAVQRVIQVEKMVERPDTAEYEVVVESDRQDS